MEPDQEVAAVRTARQNQAERDPALDGVRGLAMLMVVLIHGFTPTPTGLPTQLVHNAFESFFVAVDLFFVLSGFLITSILIRTRGSEGYLRHFYWRRILRISPAYLIVMFGCFVLLPLFERPGNATALRAAAWPHLLYVQNLVAALQAPMPVELSHFWSLAIEEQFYLLWPLAVMLLPPRHLPQVCAGLFAASCAAKLILYFSGASWLTLYVFTPCHIEGVAAGAWIASNRVIRGVLEPPRWLRIAGPLAGAALLALALSVPGKKLFEPVQVVLHTILATVTFTWLMYAMVSARPGTAVRRVFDTRVLRMLGTYSYGIYLMGWGLVLHIQYPMAQRLAAYMPGNLAMLCSGVAVTTLNISLAMLMFHLVEKPVLGFKDRGFGRRRRPSSVAAPT